MKKNDIKGFYYITHKNNIPSILKEGILCHSMLKENKLPFTPIYDKQIVSRRFSKIVPNGAPLWDFANLFFQPRNPMLYRVINEKGKNEIVILRVYPSLLEKEGVLVSDGNAAHNQSEFWPAKTGYKKISKARMSQEWWKEEDGSKREMMAECLVPKQVDAQLINTIYTANHHVAEEIKALIQNAKISVIPEPYMFFQPLKTIPISSKLYLVDGDMFFSQMHTLTISVNTVGVMGKGLASRTKYQFPDVYVYYQDLCRNKTLKIGSPCIYKREGFIDNELADEPYTLIHPNSNKWFLLFPTKNHWREKSDKVGIEKGLQWLRASYKKEKMTSLAIPALGCGLGALTWEEIGPMMCHYLHDLDIEVRIYLPREQKITEDLLSKDFLLKMPDRIG